jgi:DNA-binding PadR family transcriptional regulator
MPRPTSFTRSSMPSAGRRRVARRIHAAVHEKGAHMGRHHSHDSRGGRGGHHRQRARRGAIRTAVLTLLDERPMHGYELITELETRSGGRWRPSAGAIYPALTRMAEHGLLTSEEIDDKRQFTLTDKGRDALTDLRSAQPDDAVPPWEESGRGGRGDLRRHVGELVGQARQIGRFGSPSQIEQAAGVFEEATRQLYAILAAGDSADGATAEQTSDAPQDDAPPADDTPPADDGTGDDAADR